MAGRLPYRECSQRLNTPRTTPVKPNSVLSVVTILFLLAGLPMCAAVTVTLGPSTSPTAGQAGITNINVTGSGFPSGTILSPSITLTLQPPGPGAAPIMAAASAVTTIAGSVRRISFQIPGSVAVAAPTIYQVSLAGTTSTGISFVSGNTSALTVNPQASIGGITPSTGQQGQSILVTITGLFTNFVQGATQASFGPGISVGGAALGQPGPVTVISPISATAHLQISPTAPAGPATATVATGAQEATSSFTITSTVACTPPQVVSFDATATNLRTAGQTTLGWIATGDSVQITPGPGQLAPSDELTVNVSSTTTYTLQTTNACGNASQQLTIGVGAPFIKSISPASATPGQEITLTLGNVGGPVASALNSVVFSFASELPIRGHVEQVLPNGDVILTVPIAPTDAVPGGYATGPVSVSAQVLNVLTPGVPFTVMPLVFSGDAVSDFNVLISNLSQSTQANLSSLGSLPSNANAVAVLQPVANSYLSILSKMANDISTTGSATVPADVPSAAFPSPPTATVSREDLGTFLALFNQYSSQPTQVQAQARAALIASAGRAFAQGPFCFQDGTPQGMEYGVCRSIVSGSNQVFNFAKLVSELVSNVNPVLCVIPVSKPLPLNVIGDFFEKIVTTQTFLCNVVPVSLGVGSNNLGPDGFVHGAANTFTVRNPPPAPAGPFPLGSGQLDVFATLTGVLDPTEAGKEIANELLTDALEALPGAEAIPPQCLATLENQLQNTLPQYMTSLNTALGKIALTNARTRTLQATNCDLDHLDSADTKIIEHTGPDSGGISYGFKGNEVGATNVTIFPIKGDTLFTSVPLGSSKGRLAIDNISREYFAPVFVANPPTLSLSSINLQPGGAPKSFPSRTLAIGDTLDDSFADPVTGYSAEVKAEYFVAGASKTKWIITQTVHGGTLSGISFSSIPMLYSVNTGSSSAKVTITFQYSESLQAPGQCQAFADFRAMARDSAGKSLIDAKISNDNSFCSGPQDLQNQLVATATDQTTEVTGEISLIGTGIDFDLTLTTTIELD